MTGAAAGGAQRGDGGGGTFQLYLGLPCLPVLSRACPVPRKLFLEPRTDWVLGRTRLLWVEWELCVTLYENEVSVDGGDLNSLPNSDVRAVN